MNTLSKVTLATAAAAFFTTATVPATYAAGMGAEPVKCLGVNACKGQGKCKTAENACAGQNSCKGHGWILVPSADECTTQGGTVL
ncbi:MAG: hypothetical protein P8171_19110 [Candidatus Thiodiazotropha sp.]|jgi:uncharacterized membrane protein